MLTDKDLALLEEYGWTVECESPFEISLGCESRATGYAAEIILQWIKDQEA